MDKTKLDLLEDKSEIAREVIGKMPPWLVRWGLAAFFTFVVLFVALLHFIRFPDVIESAVILTSDNPAISIVAEADGKISLLIKDKQHAAKNDVIALVENAAKLEDVKILKEKIQHFKKALSHGNISIEEQWPDSLALGPLQYDYAELVKVFKEYTTYKTLDPIAKMIALSEDRLKTYQKLQENIEALNALEQKQSDIAEKNHARNSSLLAEQVIAQQQFEESEASYLDALELVELKKMESNSIKIKMNELRSFITEQRLLLVQKEEGLRSNLHTLIDKIESLISQWEHDYIIVNPIDGTVNFLNVWRDHLYVKKGEQICVVTPSRPDVILARARVTPSYSGKIKPGQKVRIKLNNYPYHEFGMLVGTVNSISTVTDNNGVYFVNIELPQNLESTFHVNIPFQPELSGVGEIELEKLSMLQRIFHHFRSGVTHNADN